MEAYRSGRSCGRFSKAIIRPFKAVPPLPTIAELAVEFGQMRHMEKEDLLIFRRISAFPVPNPAYADRQGN